MKEPLFETKQIEKKENYAKLEITPLARGYGRTLGNALRRVLLTSLPGTVATSVKINGVKHQFSTLKGMREDVVEFVLNLKQVRFMYNGEKEIKLKLSAKGKGEVKAGDIKTSADVEVANPDFVLAYLNKDSKIEAEITIESGVGYVTAEEHDEEKIGVIPMDSSFSPIVRVNYEIEETRVGRLTNYDKLVFEIWTDGTIKPVNALVEAAKILTNFLEQIINPKKVEKKKKKKEDTLGAVGRLSVEEIGLPTRVANALVKAGYDTVKDLHAAEKKDLEKVRNLGEKSIKIVKVALAEKGVEFLKK